MTVLAKSDAIKSITTWLDEERYEYEVVNDPIADINLAVTLSKGLQIHVIVNKEYPDMALFLCSMIFTDLEQKAFASLKPDIKQKFLHESIHSLILLKVAYEFVPNKQDMQSVRIEKVLYFDALSKNKLFELINDIGFGVEALSLARETHLGRGESRVVT